MEEIYYQGIFLDEDSIKTLIEMQGEKLPKQIKNMHCTFKFKPTEQEIKKFGQLLGKPVILKVVGYYSDGKNSGYEIELTDEQEEVYTNSHVVEGKNGLPQVEKTTPHVTVSMSENGKAVDTGMLPFEKLEKPFYISGNAGYFVKDLKRGTKGVRYEVPEEMVTEKEEDKERGVK